MHGYLVDTSSGNESTFQYRMAYIANAVNEARANAENDAVLLLDGGDIYQGTPVSNLTYGNALRAAYDAMGYDAVSLGNHEFDWNVKTYAADEDLSLIHISKNQKVADCIFSGQRIQCRRFLKLKFLWTPEGLLWQKPHPGT